MAHPILEAQDALKAILAARTAYTTTSTDVRDGGPTEEEDVSASMFWFNRVTISDDGWAALGAQRRRIEFGLGFTIACRAYGDDERSVRAACLALYEDLMLAIKANPDLTQTVQMVDGGPGVFDSVPVGPQQWGASFVGSIACTSHAY